MLTEVEELEIHVIVNDELDPISPSPNPAVKAASRFMADPSFEELEAAGATLLKSDQPHTVLDDFFLVSGEIPRKTNYEDGIYGGLRFNDSTARWEEDTLIMEERYVMCNLKGMTTHPNKWAFPGLA
ncbi:unnamed protein product [Aspergillus oryzae]|nr:unnamed protein product [Aspergillus oryzae]